MSSSPTAPQFSGRTDSQSHGRCSRCWEPEWRTSRFPTPPSPCLGSFLLQAPSWAVSHQEWKNTRCISPFTRVRGHFLQLSAHPTCGVLCMATALRASVWRPAFPLFLVSPYLTKHISFASQKCNEETVAEVSSPKPAKWGCWVFHSKVSKSPFYISVLI